MRAGVRGVVTYLFSWGCSRPTLEAPTYNFDLTWPWPDFHLTWPFCTKNKDGPDASRWDLSIAASHVAHTTIPSQDSRGPECPHPHHHHHQVARRGRRYLSRAPVRWYETIHIKYHRAHWRIQRETLDRAKIFGWTKRQVNPFLPMHCLRRNAENQTFVRGLIDTFRPPGDGGGVMPSWP